MTDYEGVDVGILRRRPRACPSNLDRTFADKGIACGLPKGHDGQHVHDSDRASARWTDLPNGGANVSSAVLR